MFKIHVVKAGDTIDSIATFYKQPAQRIMVENELHTLEDLVPGQTIVISFPEQVHIASKGDSLVSIANEHGISIKQLLRYNPTLIEGDYVYPGEALTISYRYKYRPVIS